MSLIRKVSPADIDQLHEMIVKSTSGLTRISKAQLFEDLFVKPVPKNTVSPSSGYSLDEASPDASVCNAIIAHSQEKHLLGYILYNYFYSPWKGRYANIVDFYTEPNYQDENIAMQLLNKLMELSKANGLADLLFNKAGMPDRILIELEKLNIRMIRSETSDWDVFRIHFKDV